MLEIKNFTCGYESGFMLKDINLNINRGELVGIIGPNGSGKTTLLRGITRILKSITGKILFNGKNIKDYGFKDLAQNMAVVKQSSGIGSINVKDYILLGRTPYFKKFQFFETKHDEEIAEKYMRLTDIIQYQNTSIQEISGGERQLALIARALTQEPKLLFLDEPIVYLDITHQVRVLDLLKKLNREANLTIVLVLHDLNLASEYCHKLVLMNKGAVHKIGTPEEVLTYQTIEEVYKTVVIVEKNPLSSKPFVLAVPEDEIRKK